MYGIRLLLCSLEIVVVAIVVVAFCKLLLLLFDDALNARIGDNGN